MWQTTNSHPLYIKTETNNTKNSQTALDAEDALQKATKPKSANPNHFAIHAEMPLITRLIVDLNKDNRVTSSGMATQINLAIIMKIQDLTEQIHNNVEEPGDHSL